MGEVFLADAEGSHRAALKVVRPELADDPVFRARFRREIAASARVRGTWVAKLIDADGDARRPWIATEFVPGPTLAMQVEQHGALGEDAVRALAMALANALASIWAAGVVHRDLKPANVILSERGPVLIDFGIAAAADATSLTTPGTAMGSAGWMAPEQLRGTAEPSPRQDVWGWAALVVFASAGIGPYGRGPVEALRWRALNQGLDRSAIGSVPTALLSLVAEALDADPQRRPDPEALPGLVAAACFDEPSAAARADTDITRLWQEDKTELVAPPHPVAASRVGSRAFWAAAAVVVVGFSAIFAVGLRKWGDGPGSGAPAGEATTSTTTSALAATTMTEIAPTLATSPPTTVTTSAIDAADFANWTYELDCGLGRQAFELVDGQYNSDQEFGETVRLFDVWRDDYDGDGQDEALVNLGCAAGANLVTEFVFAYDAPHGGDVIRRGGAIEVVDGFIVREAAGTFSTYEVRLAADEAHCCPSQYAHRVWIVDFNDTEVFGPTGPEELIPTDQLPHDLTPSDF